MNDIIEEVPEASATGTVADIYAEIRDTQGLALVNLIWRHLATRPAALEWAWARAKPIYAGGAAEAEAQRYVASVTLPTLPRVPDSVWRALRLTGADRRAIIALLDSYNRGNTLNLIALSALQTAPSDEPPSRRLHARPPPGETLTPIPSWSELSADTRQLVLALNRFGDRGADSPIVATLYRHLGGWPSYLALVWTELAPLASAGLIDAAVERVRNEAAPYAARAAVVRADPPAIDDSEFASAAIGTFIESAICRMVPIGLMLRASLERPQGTAR